MSIENAQKADPDDHYVPDIHDPTQPSSNWDFLGRRQCYIVMNQKS
jgi:hypothetical protein